MKPTKPNQQSTNATIFATAFPKPGKEREWEQAIGDLIRTSMSFPGHQGSLVLKPESAEQQYYRVVTKFDTIANMSHWYESDERAEKVSRLKPFQSRPAKIQQLSGFETWFTPTGKEVAASAPPKYKMFVVVWIAVYATVLPLIAILKPMMVSMPPLLASAVLAAISVALMTWVVLPALTWIFRRWLFPQSR